MKEANEAVSLTVLAGSGQESGCSLPLGEAPSFYQLEKFWAAHLESQKEVSFPYICLAIINVWMAGIVFPLKNVKLQRGSYVPTSGLTGVI